MKLFKAYKRHYQTLDIVEKQAFLMTLHLTVAAEVVGLLCPKLSKKMKLNALMAQDDLEGTMVSLKYMYGHYEDCPNSFNGR